MIARWKPVHLGHQRVLQALQRCASELIVGIGSANRWNERNPFTVPETEDMLRLALLPDFPVQLLAVEDLDNPPLWASRLASRLGPLDALVTANPWVRDCMSVYYKVEHPVTFLPPEERIPLNATMVREAWRDAQPWRHLVPGAVAEYLEQHDLVKRYRREFGGSREATRSL